MEDGGCPWPAQPLDAALQVPPPGPGELRLWCFPIDDPVLAMDALHELLDPQEQARAAAFVFERDRRRFVAAHGLMRRLLGTCVQQPPAALRFMQQPRGKPELVPHGPPLHFNLSHSQGWALLGASWEAPLGVDIEQQRELPEWHEIARSNFTRAELGACLACAPPQQLEAFYGTWVRKEAFIKATGGGLSMPLDGFEVTLDGPPASSLRAVQGDVRPAACWQLLGWRWTCAGRGPLHAAVAFPATNVALHAHLLTFRH